MRRMLPGLALLAAIQVAGAQRPSSITKPIEQAKKAVNATNAQSGAATQAARPAPVAAPASTPTPARAAAQGAAKRTEASPRVGGAAQAAPTRDSTRVAFDREVFTYSGSSRRDPFASPIETGEIRPLIQDLSVVSIIYDARGSRSVAVMRDQSTLQQYSVKVGQVLGLAKVSQIRPQEVVLTVDEYGISHQEILKLNVPGMNQQFRGKP